MGGMCCSSGGACVVPRGGACVVALGGHAWLLWGVCGCSQGGHAWLLPGGHAWDMMRYGDMINERAVRILLECILVNHEVTIGQGPGLEGGPQVNWMNIPLPFKQTTCTAKNFMPILQGCARFPQFVTIFT